MGVCCVVTVNDGAIDGIGVEISVGVTFAVTNADGVKTEFVVFSLQLMRRGNTNRTARILIFICGIQLLYSCQSEQPNGVRYRRVGGAR
jgi:hypothetical protein